MTEGRRLLLALLQRTTARRVAARCSVSASTVSRWAAGATLPNERARRALAGASSYGIPAESWASPRHPRG